MLEKESYTERELLILTSEGDEQAFQQLFTSYWGKIYVNALKFTKSPETAKDLAQEIFLKVWVNREKLTTVQQFAPYLYRIAKNTIFDHFSKRTLNEANETYLSLYFEDETADIQEKLELKELEEKIRQAIAQLPSQVQTAFRLSRIEGLSHAEIAGKMNISRITSKSYISRAILFIRDYLAEEGQALPLLLLGLFHNYFIFFYFIAFLPAILPSLLL